MLKQKEWVATYGRDAGKVFILEEMPAYQAEMFAFKLFTAMGQSGIEMPKDSGQDAAGLLQFGISSLMKIHYDLLQPLLDEMMGQVKIKMDLATRRLVDSDINEVMTRFQLRAELIKLHTDFFTADGQQESQDAQAPVANTSATVIRRRQ